VSPQKENIIATRVAVKLTILLACLLSLVLLAFTSALINMWERFSVRSAISETERFSDTLKRSAEYSMMHAQGEAVREMIDAVGQQKDVEWVRVFNKEGRIIYSTQKAEIGAVLDKNAEACYRCHAAEAPLEKLAGPDRSRILASQQDGHRVLATVEPIHNAPACSTAACHAHPESQRVLGVLDVAMSLARTDEVARGYTYTIAAAGIGMICLVCLLVALFLHGYIGRPVRRLMTGTQKIANGDFGYRIPLHGQDEISHLADSFNRMSESLGKAYGEMQGLAETLETRVQQKTEELKSAQLQVVRAEKLASLGRMAAGVAHELNNPLTGVLTFAHLLARKMPPGSQDRADLEVIISETNRCSKIIKDLLQFARETQADRKPGDLNVIIKQTISILQPQALFHNIRVQMELDEHLPQITVDSAQLKQVLLNILFNAAEAMPEGGDLAITTRAESPENVTITVADTGCGISPDDLGKVFDPFFTTKDPGKGTGLGLSVSLKLIENHGGTIEVTSALGKGSTFRVVLPVSMPVKG
jgi:two-component system NtrC family sensor kinase